MSLSDKIIDKYIAHPCLTTKDVKEFIKLLKEAIDLINNGGILSRKGIKTLIKFEIDKLAGDKLKDGN